jgi:hypothetical protein
VADVEVDVEVVLIARSKSASSCSNLASVPCVVARGGLIGVTDVGGGAD